MIDPDDTEGCPVADECLACGVVGAPPGLRVITLTVPVGIVCVTSCLWCQEAANLPLLSWSAAVGRVLGHCGHLGIDADQMEAIMAREVA